MKRRIRIWENKAMKRTRLLKDRYMKMCLKFFLGLEAKYPHFMGVTEKLSILFQIERVRLEEYRVRKGFEMPGRIWNEGGWSAEGYGDRFVRKGWHVIARVDSAAPNKVDVSWWGKGRDACATLTKLEWLSLKPYLKETEICQH